MDPPPCVQNAMMTKDKKPFTYTPGGIDLSEIKSPRMARRIERNANYGGVSEVPQNPNPYVNVGPLPPQAQAVLQPQIQVQVLPNVFPPQGGKMVPPPPPPPPVNMPPPPPMQPLPTQKVVTNNNQVVERPDMTKIIPDNPMALLKKTGGPSSRKTFVDEMFNNQSQKTPPVTAETPRYHQQEYSQPSPPPRSYQTPVIERQPSITKPSPPTPKADAPHLGSLYIPPVDQKQNQRVMSPPTPPERFHDSPKVQSPGTPTLKEAPKPWQNRPQKQQQEVPAWAKRAEEVQNNYQTEQFSPQPNVVSPQSTPSPVVQQQPQQQRWPQQQSPRPQQQSPRPQQAPAGQRWPQAPEPAQPQPKSTTIHINIRPNPQQQYSNQNNGSDAHPNAVYITQPMVFQHPGGPRAQPQMQPQQQPRVQQVQPVQRGGGDSAGVARIIPIQIEGRSPDVNDRNFSRQQSWTNNPTQSNSFKLIQKITQTDDEDDENQPITSHSPKYPQNFQDVRSPPVNNKGPQVRTIPVKFEADNGHQPYVHPSEQTVPEPKKYMGSSIPSRSFKMLQAMTAPETCANFNGNDATINEQWNLPFYPPPPYFYPNYYPEHPSTGLSNSNTSDDQNYWNYYPMYYPPVHETSPQTDTEDQNKNPQDLNVDYSAYDPYYWYYYYYYYGYPGYPWYNSEESEDKSCSGGDGGGYSSTEELKKYEEKPEVETTEPPEEPTYTEDDEPKSTCSSCSDEDDNVSSVADEDETIPHQLSVIMEETERTDSKFCDSTSVFSDDTTINSDDESVKMPDQEEVRMDSVCDSYDGIEDESTTVEEEEVGLKTECGDEEDDDDFWKIINSGKPDQQENEDVDCDLEPQNKEIRCASRMDNDVVVEEDKKESPVTTADDLWANLSEIKRWSTNLSDTTKNITDVPKRRWSVNVSNDNVQSSYSVFGSKEHLNSSEKEERHRRRWSINEISNEDNTCTSSVLETTNANENSLEVEEDKTSNNDEVEEELPVVVKLRVKNIESQAAKVNNISKRWSLNFPINSDLEPEPQLPTALDEKNMKQQEADIHSNNYSSNSLVTSDDSSSRTSPDNNQQELMSIKDRIKALRESINKKQQLIKGAKDVKVDVKTKISTIEEQEPPVVKPEKPSEAPASDNDDEDDDEDEDNDEEIDSGVTSMTDECDILKSHQYQRAATHSRLFQLLQQDEDDEEDDDGTSTTPTEDKFAKLSVRQRQEKRQNLSLPLHNINEPSNNALSHMDMELLMMKKKALGLRVVAEDMVDLETPSSGYNSWLSPLRGSTESSSPAQTPQEFYGDYCSSFDDSVPSKALKLLQEQISGKGKALPKCPRVLSAKNLKKVLDSPGEGLSMSQSPKQPVDTNTS